MTNTPNPGDRAVEAVARAADAKAEYVAFCTWAKNQFPHNDGPPTASSHLFDAWMARARHRLSAIPTPPPSAIPSVIEPVPSSRSVGVVEPRWQTEGDTSATPPPADHTDLIAEDAANWRALMASDRFKMMGAAGFLWDDEQPVKVNPEHKGWVHLGLEIWDQHEAGNDRQGVQGRQLLLAYIKHMRGQAADALQAHASPREWQDIATAPKDGTVIDLWKLAPDRIHGRRIPDVRWDNNRSFNGGIGRVAMPDAWVHSLGGGEVYLDGGLLTHWMPLPEPARTALELG